VRDVPGSEGGEDEMVARAFPVMSKLFQRCAAAPTQAVASTGVLLLVSRLFSVLLCKDLIQHFDG